MNIHSHTHSHTHTHKSHTVPLSLNPVARIQYFPGFKYTRSLRMDHLNERREKKKKKRGRGRKYREAEPGQKQQRQEAQEKSEVERKKEKMEKKFWLPGKNREWYMLYHQVMENRSGKHASAKAVLWGEYIGGWLLMESTFMRQIQIIQ